MRENPQANTLAAVVVFLLAMMFLAPEVAQRVILSLFAVFAIAGFLWAFFDGREGE